MADYQDDDDINEVDEQADEQSETDGEQSDEQTEQQADDEQEDEEDEEEALEKKTRKEIILREFNKLKARYMIRSSFWPILGFNDLKLLRQVSKINYGEYQAFMNIVRAKVGAFWAKINSMLAAIVPILPIILIVFGVIIVIMVFISVICPWLLDLSEDMKSGSPLGVNGKDFYGISMVYRDPEQARLDLQVDYIDAFSYVITDFESNEITLVKTYLPPAGYQLGDFDKNYPIANGAVIKIAEVMFVYDNPEAALPTNPALDELLFGIKYFGFDDENLDDIAAALAQYISADKSLYSAPGGVDVESELASQFEASLIEKYTFKNTNGTSLPSRTEMLYIKDYLLEDNEDATVDGVPEEDYVALIYLPKRDVKITHISYKFYGISDVENLSFVLQYNGASIAAKADFDYDVFASAVEAESEFDTVTYSLDKNIEIGSTNLPQQRENYLTNEKSIYQILLENIGNLVLRSTLLNTSGEVATFNANNGLALLVQSLEGNAFSLTEFENDYE